MTSLRTKLTALAAIPLAMLVIVAGLGVGAAAGSKSRADADAGLLRLAVAADDAALATIQERRLSVSSPDADALQAQRAQTDEAVEILTSQEGSHGHRLDASYIDVSSADEALDDLPDARALVDRAAESKGSAADDILRKYSVIVDSVLVLDQGLPGSTDGELLRELQAHRAIVRAIDQVALEESLVQEVFEAGTLTPAAHNRLTEVVASGQLWIDRFREAASPSQRDGHSRALTSPSVTNAERVRDGVLAAGPDAQVEDSAAMWLTAMDKKISLLTVFAADGAARLDGALDHERRSTGQGLLLSIALLVAALGTAVLVLYALHRLAFQPLRRVSTETQEAAAEAQYAVESGELGQDPSMVLPISAPADDELSDVVDAFNTLQDTLVSVSAERSAVRAEIQDVFLHFGRRVQNLVTRQLGQIDDLETRTDDPDMLSDLFALDHLATRLRRNAESLVVVAGSESPRPWARPVSVVNVVRAAAAEAVDYSRVDVAHMAPGAVTGANANDVSHLLAELIDNALTCSPPESRVTIAGERHPDGRYLVAISDAGLGMSPLQLEEANARLRGVHGAGIQPGEAISRSFGLYVVSQLAKRHRIAVRLVPSHLHGIRAEVVLSRFVMVLPTDAQNPEIEATGTRSTPETRLTPPPPEPRPADPRRREALRPVTRPPVTTAPAARAPMAGRPTSEQPAVTRAPFVGMPTANREDVQS